MAHRRPGRTLTRRAVRGGATALALALLASACGTLPRPAPDSAPEAEGAPVAAPLPEPAPRAATTTESGPEAAGPGAHPTASPEPSVTGAEPDPAPPPAPARWFPEPGTTQRLAGLTPADGARYVEERTVRAGAGVPGLELSIAVRRVGGAPWSARDTYVVELRDDEVRIALAPDPVRALPPAARELPLPPTVGATWTTAAGTCRVEAVGVEVATFAGPRGGCARVVVTGPDGRTTTRWFDPALGEVRREARDRQGRLLAGWALCGDAPPPEERLRELFAAPRR